VKRFRAGLVFKAHKLLYHSTLASRVIKKKKKRADRCVGDGMGNGELGGVQRLPLQHKLRWGILVMCGPGCKTTLICQEKTLICQAAPAASGQTLVDSSRRAWPRLQ